MKKFFKPELQRLPFDVEDILTTSSVDTPDSGTPAHFPTIDEDEGVIV